jgi:hypothetical protein
MPTTPDGANKSHVDNAGALDDLGETELPELPLELAIGQ